jgi:hypothetical protein
VNLVEKGAALVMKLIAQNVLIVSMHTQTQIVHVHAIALQIILTQLVSANLVEKDAILAMKLIALNVLIVSMHIQTQIFHVHAIALQII